MGDPWKDILRFDGAVERDPVIAAWFAQHGGPREALARWWFDHIRAMGPDVRELFHDGRATLCVDDAPFAYVGIYTAHVAIGFYRGAMLEDPSGLLRGSGKRMRHVRLEPEVAINEGALASLITAAYADMQRASQRR